MTARQATDPPAQAADRELKAATRAAWALGDYHRFAKATVWERGMELVDACGISARQRVLDVAAGTGNTAIRAAEAGARVVASDLTPENFEAGHREARARGVELEWVEADAEALPFADGEFDVVTSSFGAIFAPDHQAVADEMLRVCRPGGTIGMLNFTPEGLFTDFLGVFAPYVAPPPRVRAHRRSGAASNTCASSSASGSSSWSWPAASTARRPRTPAVTSSSSSRPSAP